jgi:hypothetical protein
MGKAIPLHEATLADRMRVLGRDHPNTKSSERALRMAVAVAGIPADDVELVDYWLGTESWIESFEVLDAAEDRLRGQAARAELGRRAAAGDRAAMQHQRILAAATGVDRKTLWAVVTDPNQALQAALVALDTGNPSSAFALIGCNPAAANHPHGLAITLSALASRADKNLPDVIQQINAAGLGGEVGKSLTTLLEALESPAGKEAAAAVLTQLAGGNTESAPGS